MHNALIHFLSSFVPTKRLRRRVRARLKERLIVKSGMVTLSGQNNQIVVKNETGQELPLTQFVPELTIQLHGKNNKIIFHGQLAFKGTINIDSEDAVIEIGENVRGNINVRAKYGHAQKLFIGNNTSMFGVTIILDEMASVKIGSNVLIATGVVLQASDGHAVLDADTNEPINAITKSLIIEDNVWIGTKSILLKNSHIHRHSVLGAGTIACKDYKESNVVIAGNPAKIIKRNISWDPRSPWKIQEERKKYEKTT